MAVPNIFSAFTKIQSALVNANFSALANGSADETANSLIVARRMGFTNFVYSGMTIATSVNLTTSIAAGISNVNGQYLANVLTSQTFTASKDTYVDQKDDGTFVQVPVTNGATTGMTLTTNSGGSKALRIAKVVTSGTAITSVTQTGADPLGNLIAPVSAISVSNLQNPVKFSVWLNTDTSITNTTLKVPWDQKEFDSGNNFDIVTNRRFTATSAGFYQMNVKTAVGSAGMGTTENCYCAIYKNGVEYIRSDKMNGSGDANRLVAPQVSKLIQLSANDYLEVFVVMVGSRDIFNGQNLTFWSGFLESQN